MTRTLVAVTALALVVAPRALAQQPDTTWGLRPRWRHAEAFRIVPPDAFMGAGRLAPRRSDPAELAAEWARALARRLAERDAARWRAGITGDTALLAVPPRPVVFATTLPPDDFGNRTPLMSRLADLGLALNALFEMRFDRLRNLRCTAADANQIGSACRGGFNPPRIEPQFNIRTGGVVGQRIHVNVDYDSEREFDASNNIQVYYEGLDDEIVRRVQVGNVTPAAPPLRLVTAGVPANNFGIQAEGQLGALDFGLLYAQQKGNVVRGRTFTVGDATVQAVDREDDDNDFEPGRFFFVVDPAQLPGYPAVDVLNLSAEALPDSVRVASVRLYRRRGSLTGSGGEQNLTGIEAVALRPDSPQRAGPWSWELLLEGRDYYLDPSGVWFALSARLDTDDYLAASWVTPAGDTVGTFPATAGPGVVDTLRLIHEPRRGADLPTFRYEMRNAYRVGSSDDITRASVALTLRVAGSEKPASGSATFLQLLGLALESDATRFDEYNRLFPRVRDPGSGAPVRDWFVIFPHLTPFADSVLLTSEYRTDSLYRTPTYLVRTQGPTPLFQLALRYDAAGGDNRGSLSLGGFQIREGSERLTAGGRPLTRTVHYTINYEIGQVTFLNPDSLFPQPTQVTAQYEENQAFAIAPTTVMGLHGRYDLGEHGSFAAMGLFQRERTTFTRPPLGFEPSSNFVGGVAGNFLFEPSRLTRLLDALPLVRTEAPSRVSLDVEFATSRPSPNQLGVAYVETFESEGGTFLPLDEDLWELGSRPQTARGLGATGVDPVGGFLDVDAAPLTWQNLVAGTTTPVAQFRPQDIDPAIRLIGTGTQAERVMFLALHPDTVGGLNNPLTFAPRWILPHGVGRPPHPRWRTLTLPLSATGLDLTRVEYLEFWVLEDPARRAAAAGTTVAFDFGTMFEDAVAFVPDSFTVGGGDTTYTGRHRNGVGRLDTERDSLTNTFNAARNDTGIHGAVADTIRDAAADTLVRGMPLCRSALAQGLVVYSWGSLLSGCTRGNGRADAEDLNNDQRLDTLIRTPQEDHVRFVFPLGDPRYYVRDGATAQGMGTWRLYRIPFRADTVQVGLPDLRQMRALRMTIITPAVAAESVVTFALARMKLVGAPWVKRSGTPIAGLAGERGESHGEVVASVISTENRDDLGYEPPPGVTDAGASTSGGLQLGAQQINERSLRVIASDVRQGERAEAFYRFPEGERNFLGYRALRVWARGRGAGWSTRELSFFIKVGHDEDNFYLYRAHASTTTWEPEAVVDFNQWLALRALVETRYLRGDPPSGAALCGGDTLAWVACAGPYVVHVRNPGVAPPNLSRVQELAVGLVRDSASVPDTAELWVDDLRLSGVVDDAGYAASMNLLVNAADVADVGVQLTRRDGNFRQLGDDPSYVTTNNLAVNVALRLEKLGLEPLGIRAPLTFRTDRAGRDPYYLNRTDVLASSLDGLRRPEQRTTSWSLQVRRTRRGTAWWQRAFADNLSFAGLWSSDAAVTELSRATSRTSEMRGDYILAPGNVSVGIMPGFLARLLDGLPGFLRDADFVEGLRGSRLRLTPAAFSVSAAVNRAEADRFTFRAPIPLLSDTAPPVATSNAMLRSAVRFDLRPFSAVGLGLDLSTDRDLKDYGDTTTIGRVAEQGRRRLLGADVGFERTRRLGTRFSWTPPALSWLRPRVNWVSDFAITRDPNARDPERAGGDSTGAFRLPTAFISNRSTDLAATVDVGRALRGLLGDSSNVRRAVDIISQLDVGRRIERRSQFDRPGFDPGFSYQIGWGGEAATRSQEGRLATSAASTVQDRVGAGLRLPLGVSVTGTYAVREGNVWSLRSGQQQLQRTTERDWPNVTARWLWSPRIPWLRGVVSSVSGSASVREREAAAEQPGLGETGVGVRSSQVFRSRPYTFGITWAPRITTNLSWSADETRSDRPGSVTFNDRNQLAADASFMFRMPPEIVPLRSDIRTTVRFSDARDRICVERTGFPGCTPISDSRRQEYAVALDTDMPPSVTAGLSAGYVLTEDRHVNRKFSQFTLTATVRIAFQVGEIQ